MLCMSTVTGNGQKGQDGGSNHLGRSQSARRLLRVLLAFDEGAHTHSARQLAKVADMPLPTAHRYVALLRGEGLLVEAGAGTYRLSPRVFALARAAQAAEPILSLADPIMRKLSAEIGETVLLVEVVWDSAVCAHRIESMQRLRLSYQPGQSLSLTRGASAKVLLSGFSEERREWYLNQLEPTRRLWFRREVESARRAGWASSEEEIDEGIWAVAAAVTDRGGVAAALTVPCPRQRVRAQASRETIVEEVRSAAAALSDLLRDRNWEIRSHPSSS